MILYYTRIYDALVYYIMVWQSPSLTETEVLASADVQSNPKLALNTKP